MQGGNELSAPGRDGSMSLYFPPHMRFSALWNPGCSQHCRVMQRRLDAATPRAAATTTTMTCLLCAQQPTFSLVNSVGRVIAAGSNPPFNSPSATLRPPLIPRLECKKNGQLSRYPTHSLSRLNTAPLYSCPSPFSLLRSTHYKIEFPTLAFVHLVPSSCQRPTSPTIPATYPQANGIINHFYTCWCPSLA